MTTSDSPAQKIWG